MAGGTRRSRRSGRRIRPIHVAASLALAGGGLAAWLLLGRSQAQLSPVAAAQSFRVVYAIEDSSGDQTVFRTEILEVRRPYDVRIELRQGAPPGDQLISGRVTSRTHLWMLDADGAVQVGFRRAPAGPARDVSAFALQDGVRAGHAEARGTGRVLGRTCNIYRYGDPAPEALGPPSRSRSVESCVAPNGIALREVWSFEGNPTRTTEALSVELVHPDDSRFLIGQEPPTTEAGELVAGAVVVRDDLDPAAVVADFAPPAGFALDRRAVVSDAGLAGQARPRQSYLEAYLSGVDLVILERATVAGGSVPWDENQGDDFQAGPMGRSRIVYFVDRVEIRFAGAWGFARVTAPSQRLAVTFASQLRPVS